MNSEFVVSQAHPSLPGHFPGHPIVPGVVMLSYVCDVVNRQFPGQSILGIKRLKFLRPLFPEQPFRVEVLPGQPNAAMPSTLIKFRCWGGDILLSEGQLSVAPRSAGDSQLQGE